MSNAVQTNISEDRIDMEQNIPRHREASIPKYQDMFDRAKAIIKQDTCMAFYDEARL